ncbi:MAG: ABC transporter ATP-binding protein [Candidatus Obscuribacterales bacterium]|nr:ABC transporter ATP-binding protein [Candidatus Obscuribacterales bacterium]
MLNISELSFTYGKAGSPWTIKDLSLSVGKNEIVSILGASGCGKSTLLNLIAGLLLAQTGKIELSESDKSKQKIGYIFQHDPLFPWQNVEKNLQLSLKLGKAPSKEWIDKHIEQYFKLFHLDKQVLKKFPQELSGGMRQRVSIIQALLFNPQLLLLDEPFSALDFYTKLCLEDEFFQLVKEQNKAALLVTHDIEEAIAMSDRILIMSKNGSFSNEFILDFATESRLPSTVRSSSKFAQYYGQIWSELKAVIAQ